MAFDSDFIKCRDGTYVARRLVARIERRVDERAVFEYVLFDDHGDEIGRTRADIRRPTLVSAVGWTHWVARFDPEDPDEKWIREAEPVVAWDVGERSCRPIGASYGPLPLLNFPSGRMHLFRYLEEARDGRRRYWAAGLDHLRVYESIGELEAEIRRFIAAVRAKAAEGAEDE